MAILGQFWPLPVGRISPKMPKGTSTGREHLNETIIDSLGLSVLEILPGQSHKAQIFYFGLFFLAILALPVGRIWPKIPKGTFTGPDLSNKPQIKSLRLSVPDISPGQKAMSDRQTDTQSL